MLTRRSKAKREEDDVMTIADLAAAGASVVSCRDNPSDLRPAVAAILRKIEQADAKRRGDQPLVVIMGEYHHMPAHIMLQQFLVNALLAQEGVTPACGFEVDYNFLGKALNKNLGLNLDYRQGAALAHTDCDGRRGLAAMIAYTDLDLAPAAHLTQMDYCLRAGLPARFNDLSKTLSSPASDLEIDMKDPLSRRIVREGFWKAYKRSLLSSVYDRPYMGTSTTDGMDFRNRAIVMNALNHQRDSVAPVYVQSTGRCHVFGNREDGEQACPYDTSLAARFQQAGAIIVPVCFFERGLRFHSMPPAAALVAMENAVFITDAASETFNKSQKHEADLIDCLMRHSGAKTNIVDPRVEECPRIGALRQAVADDAPQWIRECTPC